MLEAQEKIFQKTQCEVAWSSSSSDSGWEDRLLYSNCMEAVAVWSTVKESVLWLLLLFYLFWVILFPLGTIPIVVFFSWET